ncbi:Ig-like domain-containing protein, partial [Sulfurimonas sp.]|nr:Ig-like domain-containing protein [Sulfurimonas sp.]
MSSVIGTVASIDGKFQIKDANGNIREGALGDEIHVGEVIIGDKRNGSIDSIVVTLDNGNDIVLFGKEKQLFDTSLFNSEFAENETVSESDSIERMFSDFDSDLDDEDSMNEDDIDDIETEAGEEESTQSTEGGEANFAQNTGDSVDINADLRHKSFADRFDEEKDKEKNEDDDEFKLGNFGVYRDGDGDDTWVNLDENNFEDDERDLEFNIALDAVNEIFNDGKIVENLTNAIRPVLTGTANPNSDFFIKDENGNIIGSGKTDEDGNFQIQVDEMDDGDHTFTLVTKTYSGRDVEASTNVTIDTNIVNFTASKETDANEVVYSGTGEAGSIVSVVDENGRNFGDVTVDMDGRFEIRVDKLDDDSHDFELKIKDIAGNEASININNAATITVTTVDTITTNTLVDGSKVASIGVNDLDGDIVSLTLSDTVNYKIVGNEVQLTTAGVNLVQSGTDLPSFTITANDGTVDTVSRVVNLADSATITINEDSGLSSSDNITDDNTVNIGSIDSTSTWEYSTDGGSTWTTGTGSSFQLAENTVYNENDIQVKVIDENANEAITTIEQAIDVDTRFESLTIDDVSYTADSTPVFTGTVSDSNLDRVEVTINGETYEANLHVDGTWSVETGNSVPDGDYEVSVTAYDKAGNTAS